MFDSKPSAFEQAAAIRLALKEFWAGVDDRLFYCNF